MYLFRTRPMIVQEHAAKNDGPGAHDLGAHLEKIRLVKH